MKASSLPPFHHLLSNPADHLPTPPFLTPMVLVALQSLTNQVATMQILDTYFRPDAPDAIAVPMSEGCRTTTLQFKASSVYIFDRARAEMLEKMGIEKVHPVGLSHKRMIERSPPPVVVVVLGPGLTS